MSLLTALLGQLGKQNRQQPSSLTLLQVWPMLFLLRDFGDYSGSGSSTNACIALDIRKMFSPGL